MKLVKEFIAKKELENLAKERFGDLVKAVVDVNREIMALGADLHADEEAALLEDGSKQEDLWGINIYPFLDKNKWIEFDSVINLRPSQNNRSREIENPTLREKIIEIVNKLII
ncbi:MAG: DUF5674 family protein [Candidatus Margulisiibacteriota bacterium]